MSNQSSPARLRVLLVEDEPLSALLTTRTLDALGHEVVHVETGADAARAFACEAFDVHLIDVGLPDMDGCEVARDARRCARDAAPALFALTAGHADRAREQPCFDAVLDKPLDPAAFERALSARVQARPSLPELDLADLRDRAGDDDALVREVLLDFDRLGGEWLGTLASAVERSRNDEIASVSHRFKGALLAIGAKRAAASAQALEHATRDRDAGSAARVGAAMQDFVVRLEAVRRLIGEHAEQGGQIPVNQAVDAAVTR